MTMKEQMQTELEEAIATLEKANELLSKLFSTKEEE